MLVRSRWLPVAAPVVAMTLVAGCGDDPVCPCDSEPWSDVLLPDLGDAALIGIAARGSRVVVIGTGATSASAVGAETSGGLWEMLSLPPSPAGTVFLGVALDRSGKAILVGGSPANQPLVVDERADWQTIPLAATGHLNAVTTDGGDSLLAVGTASSGLAASSTAPGSWTTDHAGFTTPQEKGLVDVSSAGGVFVACGWDDNTLQPVVRRLDDSGWKDISGPGIVLPPEFRIEHRAVDLEPSGALWVGGTIVESTATGDRFAARLARRTSTADWIDIVLPQPAALESVNDILQAQNGDVYLACGETVARVLRWDGMRWLDEGPAVPGRMLALAEDATGRIFAAGVRTGGTTRPLLRVRTP